MLPTLWLPEITIRQPHFVTTAAFTLIEGILTGQIAGPLPSSVILTAAQIAQIQAAVNSYNAIIAVEAQSHGAALVNIHGILNLIQARGVVENGQRSTTARSPRNSHLCDVRQPSEPSHADL